MINFIRGGLRGRAQGWLAFAVLIGMALGAKAEDPAAKRLVAYYYFGDLTTKPHYDARNIPYSKLTHLIHVAVEPSRSADGTIVISPNALEPLLITRAHRAGVKVLVCVQGPAKVFRQIAGAADTRKKFAESLKDFVTIYKYDGVDIDWEVPKGTNETADCTLMMAALRKAMPSPQYLLSMATTSTPGGWGDFDFNGLTPILDFYNIMTYDYHGPWGKRAGHNSPLFPSNFDDQGSLDKTLNLYLTRFAVPPEKINLGTAFYGYEFHAPDINTDVKSDLKTKTRNYGPYTKPRINKNGWERRFDPVAMAPYLVHVGEPVGFITYDDEESTARKVMYALKVRNLGGVFMWELSADFDGKHQDLMDAMYQAFRKAKKDAAR